MRRRTAVREWEPGQALPSVAELADYYGVSRTAVSRALKALESDGLVRIVPRWGTFKA
jgi:DNA-binding GntR family transcriptional regulator